MSPSAILFFVYLVIGLLLALVVVIGRNKEGGFWSSYPWAAEPLLFSIAMLVWPITLLVLLLSSPKRKL